MFTRKTYLSGLQFAVYFSLIAQSILALLFNAMTPNIYRAIVTHDCLKSFAWVKNMYPGYLEHTVYYEWSIALVGIFMIYRAVRTVNVAGHVEAFLKEEPSLKRQASFAAFFAGGVLLLSSLTYAVIDGVSLVYSSVENTCSYMRASSLVMSTLLFIMLMVLLGIQGRRNSSAGSHAAPLVQTAATSMAAAALFYFLQSQSMQVVAEKLSLPEILEYLCLHCTQLSLAAGFTAGMALLGFLSGLGLSIASMQAGGDEQGGWKRELAVFLALLALLGGLTGFFSQKVLREKLHFFTAIDQVIPLREGRSAARHAIIFSTGSSPLAVNLTLERTFYTDENMATLSRYLSRYGSRTLYSDTVLARLADQCSLNWDVPGFLQVQQRKITSRPDNVLDIMMSLALLKKNLPDQKLVPFVDCFTSARVFSFPGAASCLLAATILEHYGYPEKARPFVQESRRKPANDRAMQGYLKEKKEAPRATSEVSGQVLHNGLPLEGVKVRLFPLMHSTKTEEQKIREIADMLEKEKYCGTRDRNFFQHNAISNFLIVSGLYAITTTDAAGRFSFSHLPPDEYRVVILLEGPASSFTPTGSPGAVRITQPGSHLALPAIELQ
jgi:hypothetical protein